MSKGFFRILGKLPSFFSMITGGMLGLIVCLLVGFEGSLSFSFNNQASAPNAVLFAFALGLILLCLAGGRLVHAKGLLCGELRFSRRFRWCLAIAHGALFLVQWVMVRSLWYYAGWDAAMVREAAIELAKGLPLSRPDYFQLCPNNAPISLLLAIPYAAGLALGMAEPYVLLLLCGAACANIASLLTVLSVARLTKSRGATGFAFLLSTGFVLLSPYIAVAYTDIFSILFPVLCLYLWLSQLKTPLKWFLIALCGGFGIAIKATVGIFILALVVITGLRRLSSLPFSKKAFLRTATVSVAMIIGFAPGLVFQRTACAVLAGAEVPQKQLSMSHYLMMGLNPKTYGGHSPDDVEFSQSFETLAQRQQANYQEAFRRLTAMDLPTAGHFFSVKLFKAYDSGTFAWNGSFLPAETPRRTDSLSAFLRSIYHNGKPANSTYISVYQTVWLFLLTLGTCAFFLTRKSLPHTPVIALTLLGLTLYLILFECWPRYLFLYAPFYVIAGMLGLQALTHQIFKKE